MSRGLSAGCREQVAARRRSDKLSTRFILVEVKAFVIEQHNLYHNKWAAMRRIQRRVQTKDAGFRRCRI